ncbi:ead/Ea22-like family protein [Enterobacter kobei]|uniref:ead/Ea22-like family protein n=1 Tax=Enterobacter kobei TaxID=208224 RepID=UPI002147F27E|nr:ead/Ea22-like family protein [Enterobacter kobei]EMB6163478.1 hypothetical protein [Enterobacter kobei]
MSNIDKRPYRAGGGDIGTGRIREIADNPYGDEEKCWLAKRVLALLDELEAKDRRNSELTEALKQTVSGYKSCLRMGHDRILDLGGDCDSPEVMIAGNPDIQQAEKLIAAAAGKGEAS